MPQTPISPEHLYYHALCAGAALGYGALKKLRAEHGSWQAAYATTCSSYADTVRADELWTTLTQTTCRLILQSDPDFPPLLREIPHTPHALYVRGDLPALDQYCLAVVGTRRASSAGTHAASTIARELASAGVGIISGLAFGIDSAAHRGALAGRGATIAVLASGCLQITPRSNQGLADQILAAGGAIISEYPPDADALPHQFIERNRIISGLAKATLVIEAPARSGTLATARFAVEQNRELLVLPGGAGTPHYRGSHRLIRAGARLVENTADILEDLGLQQEAIPGTATLPFLDEPAQRVVELLTTQGVPLTADDIAEQTTLSISVINQSLGMLALHTLVTEDGGRYALAGNSTHALSSRS
jgi:DNA processing protein